MLVQTYEEYTGKIFNRNSKNWRSYYLCT